MTWRLRTWAIVGGLLALAATGIANARPSPQPWRVYVGVRPDGSLDVRRHPSDDASLPGVWSGAVIRPPEDPAFVLDIVDAGHPFGWRNLLQRIGLGPGSARRWARSFDNLESQDAWAVLYAVDPRIDDGDLAPDIAGHWSYDSGIEEWCGGDLVGEITNLSGGLDLRPDGIIELASTPSGWWRLQGDLLAVSVDGDTALYCTSPGETAWRGVPSGGTLTPLR